MTGEKVGDLYAELGIKDVTPQQLRDAERSMARSVDRMERIDDPKLGVETKGFDQDLHRAEQRLGKVGDNVRPIRPEVDVSHVDDQAGAGGRKVGDMVKSWGTAAALAAGVIGATVGKEFVDSFMSWAEREAQGDRLAAAIGLTGAEAARVTKIATDIYKQGWGSSVAEVGAAVTAARQNGLIDGGSTKKEIEELTTRMLDFVGVWGQDLPGVAKAAGQMVKTGVAKDVWEAMDIMAKGFSNGANKSDDLLDTFNEYSTMFRSLGIDGQTALGLISQGLQGGARDSDIVADSLKEFSIRAKDGSTTTADGFHGLGMDASDAADKIAKGGKGASDVLGTVLDRLRGTEDPVKRNAIAIALFGTQAEDLQAALYKMDPDTAVKALGKVAGAAEKASETANDNVAADLEALQRRTKLAVEDYLGSLWTAYDEGGFTGLTDKLTEDTKKLGDWWDENGDAITEAIRKWWEESGSPLVAQVVGDGLKAAFGVAWDNLVNYVKDPANWMLPAVGGMVKDWIDDTIESIGDGLSDAVDGLFDPIGNSFISVLNMMIDGWNSLEFKLPSFAGFKVAGQTVIPGWEGPTLGTPELPKIPHFAQGGYVPGPVGSPVLAVVHGGEKIMNPAQQAADEASRRYPQPPAPQAARGGNTTNIYTASPQRWVRDMPWERAG